MTGDDHHDVNAEDDAYIGLEQESEATKRFVKEANKFCLTALNDPTQSPIYSKILNMLEADDRIPFVSKMGSVGGDDELYNLWKDAKVHTERRRTRRRKWTKSRRFSTSSFAVCSISHLTFLLLFSQKIESSGCLEESHAELLRDK